MTIIDLGGAEAIAYTAHELAKIMNFNVNYSGGILTQTVYSQSFFRENFDHNGNISDNAIIKKRKDDAIKRAKEITDWLGKYHIKYDVQVTDKTGGLTGMGEYRYSQKITVNPTQLSFFDNANKLVQAMRFHNRIEAAKSALVESGFEENARPLKMLDAAEMSRTHKVIGGLRTRWHRLRADPGQFKLAREKLVSRGFVATEPAIDSLNLAA